MTDLLWYRGMRLAAAVGHEQGLGRADAGLDQCLGERMNTGWDFFDARGNQGHMYAYFRFFAQGPGVVLSF